METFTWDVPPEPAPKKKTSAVPGVVLVVLAIAVGVIGFNVLSGETETAQASSTEGYTTEFLSSAIGSDSPLPPPGADFPHIVYEDGLLYVRGVASSPDMVTQTVRQLEEIFGVGSVVPEVVIDANFVDQPDGSTSVYFTENVLFKSGSAIIEPEFFDILGASAKFLQLSPETTIRITGHTDTDGDEESNLLLSQARVDAAREAMISQGGDPDRITALGLGETQPIADNDTAEGRQLNRRVELTLNPDDNDELEELIEAETESFS